MSTIKDLIEKRGAAIKAVSEIGRAMQAENRAMSSEERTKFETAKTDITALEQRIKDQRELDAIAAKKNPVGRSDYDPKSGKGGPTPNQPTAEDRRLAFDAWARGGQGLKRRHQVALKRTGFNAANPDLTLRLRTPEQRAASVGTPSAGGYTVAEEWSKTLEVALKKWNAVRMAAGSLVTDKGGDFHYPTVNDTAQTGEQLGENTEVAYQDATYSEVVFKAYKFSSKCAKVSSELIEDSSVDFGAVTLDLLAQRIGRIQGARFTTGTGTGQPQGCVTGAAVGRTAASATAFTSEDLIRLFHSVDEAYRSDPTCAYMMHGDTLAYCSLFTDGTGRPLLLQNYAQGGDLQILGKRVVTNPYMASSLVADALPVLFGAWSKFVIRDVGKVRIRRLEERFAEYDQVAFVLFMRSDSKLLDAGTNPLKSLKLAAA